MVGAWAHLRDLASRPALELAILQHGKVNPTDRDSREVNADAAIHRRWIRGVRQMPRLLALHLVDILHRKLVPPIGAAREGRVFTALTPHVTVTDVVVVRDADRGPVADDIAKLQTKLDPPGGVLSVAVGLVATEKQQVGILPPEVGDNLRSTAGGVA